MRVIDSHTEGEPTRVIIDGGPELGGGSVAEQLQRLVHRHDDIRRTVILEPRGSDAVVGALLCPPADKSCVCGVIFFNNTGYLGMCGHGMIGVAVTLGYLGRVVPGEIRIETPVGVVAVELKGPNEATIENVPSYRYQQDVELDVPDLGIVRGDVAWGGNWFFLVDGSPVPITLANVPQLTTITQHIKQVLVDRGITGADGAEIDHIELFEAPAGDGADSRNFVLCPGNEYDRSPCGTGTSAKIACLADDGKLEPGATWTQESVIGSRFIANYRRNENNEIIPSISGRAYICGETTLIQQADDPFATGIS